MGGVSTEEKDLIGWARGWRLVFLESSWNVSHAVSLESPFSSSNVNHKHQEAITDNKSPKWVMQAHSSASSLLTRPPYARPREKRASILWLSRRRAADRVIGAKHGEILRKAIPGSQTNWTSQTLQCSASRSVLGHELSRNAARFWEACPRYQLEQFVKQIGGRVARTCLTDGDRLTWLTECPDAPLRRRHPGWFYKPERKISATKKL